VELRWQRDGEDPDGPWNPAGPDWQQARRTDVVRALTATEVQGEDPGAMAARWAEVLGRQVTRDGAGNPTVGLDDGVVRFVEPVDGRGPGLGGIDVEAADRDRLLAAAERRGCRVSDELIVLCGTRIRLV
jgi:hypothetical protein